MSAHFYIHVLLCYFTSVQSRCENTTVWPFRLWRLFADSHNDTSRLALGVSLSGLWHLKLAHLYGRRLAAAGGDEQRPHECVERPVRTKSRLDRREQPRLILALEAFGLLDGKVCEHCGRHVTKWRDLDAR